jgi:hypothetical protein
MKSGNTLGYKIMPYDPEGVHKYKNYSFKGFHIPINRSKKAITVKLQNPKGGYYPLSEREIRILVKSNTWALLLVFLIIPPGVMAFMLIRRSRVYGNGKKEKEKG